MSEYISGTSPQRQYRLPCLFHVREELHLNPLGYLPVFLGDHIVSDRLFGLHCERFASIIIHTQVSPSKFEVWVFSELSISLASPDPAPKIGTNAREFDLEEYFSYCRDAYLDVSAELSNNTLVKRPNYQYFFSVVKLLAALCRRLLCSVLDVCDWTIFC